MKTLFLTVLFSLLLYTGAVCAESDLPAGYTLCEDEAACAHLGAEYKCLPQKYPCGPAETCAARVCMKEASANAAPPPTAEEKECAEKGGQWQGTIQGRGRLTGCNMPTKDGGKSCKSGEDCESVCLLDGTCYGWQMYKGCALFKGHKQAMCFE